MTADEYLNEVLASQAMGDDSDEVKALQKHRADVEKLIRDSFKDNALTIRYAGSKAKGTMNRESYDLDIISYVSSGDNTAGETLEDIYNNHKKALAKKYYVEPKGSALRLKGCDPENLGVPSARNSRESGSADAATGIRCDHQTRSGHRRVPLGAGASGHGCRGQH